MLAPKVGCQQLSAILKGPNARDIQSSQQLAEQKQIPSGIMASIQL